MAGGGQVAAQGLDGRRLAGAGDAGDTDPLGLAGVRHQLFQQRPGGGLMIGPPAFDQGDGARQGGAVAGEEVTPQGGDVGHAAHRPLLGPPLR